MNNPHRACGNVMLRWHVACYWLNLFSWLETASRFTSIPVKSVCHGKSHRFATSVLSYEVKTAGSRNGAQISGEGKGAAEHSSSWSAVQTGHTVISVGQTSVAFVL